MSEEELIEGLRRSAKRYGAAYPVLVDAQGRLIDGAHRLKALPRWPKAKVDWIKDEYDLLAFRMNIHKHRREVSEKERFETFRKMAQILEKRGLSSKNEQARRISADTGFSEEYVREALKEPEEGGVGGHPQEKGVMTKPPTPPAPEEFREKAREFGKLGGRPPAYLLVCPQCGYKGKRSSFGRIQAE